MVGGGGSVDQARARSWAYRDPRGFASLIDIIVDVSIEYLNGQVEAGADVVQIFDSWAGALPDDQFEAWVIVPTAKIVGALKVRHPEVPIIGFPRGAGVKAPRFVSETGVDGVSCDTATPLDAMKRLAEESRRVVQGNLDPLLLVAGGEAMERRVIETMEAMRTVPFVFNLGHGIVPQTPPEHVAQLVDLVRGRGG
jgi:uroporphyrinogen decarboxylase